MTYVRACEYVQIQLTQSNPHALVRSPIHTNLPFQVVAARRTDWMKLVRVRHDTSTQLKIIIRSFNVASWRKKLHDLILSDQFVVVIDYASHGYDFVETRYEMVHLEFDWISPPNLIDSWAPNFDCRFILKCQHEAIAKNQYTEPQASAAATFESDWIEWIAETKQKIVKIYFRVSRISASLSFSLLCIH